MLKQKFLSITAVFMLTIFGAGSAFAAEIKIAYVHMNTLMAKSKPAKQARALLDKEFGPRKKKIRAKIATFNKMRGRLKKDHATMSKSQLISLERKIRSLKRDLKRDTVELREDQALRNNEVGVKLQKKITATIVSLAKREKYDLVLRQGVFHYSKRVDITGKVLAELAK